MKRAILFLALFTFLSCAHLDAQAPEINALLPEAAIAQIEPFKKRDRILILAPHPDDEAIACSGVIQAALAAGAEVRIVFLTNGDHNQVAFIVYEKRLTFRKGEFIHMGEVRKKESIKAMKSLGLSEEQLIFLGYPDFGTFRIFKDYWKSPKPFKDVLTRISSVPYRENLSYGAPYVAESILRDLTAVLKKYRPNKVFVSHPGDTNPDHKSFYLFLQIALSDLEKVLPRPKIYPYLIHCLHWPLPRHYHPDLPLLPAKKFTNSQIKWLRFNLNKEALEKKHQAVLSYKSQTESSAFYLLSFCRRNELFGDYPDITFGLKQSGSSATSFYGLSKIFGDWEEEERDRTEDPGESKGEVSYGMEKGVFLTRIDKAKALNKKPVILLYLFGYSHNRRFSEMPKIRLFLRNNKVRLYDGKKKLDAEGISFESNGKELILKVPLKIIGEPDFILVSLKIYSKSLPADTVSFRKIILKRR